MCKPAAGRMQMTGTKSAEILRNGPVLFLELKMHCKPEKLHPGEIRGESLPIYINAKILKGK